jgi:hypothetical protein
VNLDVKIRKVLQCTKLGSPLKRFPNFQIEGVCKANSFSFTEIFVTGLEGILATVGRAQVGIRPTWSDPSVIRNILGKKATKIFQN